MMIATLKTLRLVRLWMSCKYYSTLIGISLEKANFILSLFSFERGITGWHPAKVIYSLEEMVKV